MIRQGRGGYVHCKYDFSSIKGSNYCGPEIDSLWMKPSLKNARTTYICSFYQPPDGSAKSYIDFLDNQINNIVTVPISDVIMLRDDNIEWSA